MSLFVFVVQAWLTSMHKENLTNFRGLGRHYLIEIVFAYDSYLNSVHCRLLQDVLYT